MKIKGLRQGRKIGGPPKRDPRPGERFTIATRVRPELKRRLDAAAEESGRSQAQETELRLERSFDRTDLLREVLALAFGKEPAGLLLMLGHVMWSSGNVILHQEGRSPLSLGQWISDPAAYDQAMKGAIRVLNALRPPGKVPQSAADVDGVQIADDMIRAVGGGPINMVTLPAQKIRELLGAIADRCKDFEPGKQSEDGNPFDLAMAVHQANRALEDFAGKQRDKIWPTEPVVQILKRYLGDFLVSGWERCRLTEEDSAGSEELAAEIRRRA